MRPCSRNARMLRDAHDMHQKRMLQHSALQIPVSNTLETLHHRTTESDGGETDLYHFWQELVCGNCAVIRLDDSA